MAEAVHNDVRLPDDRPPAWANSMMRWALTAPGIQGLVGKGVALLTFTGRRTGKSYTVPVSYRRDGDVVTVITKRSRRWWHNFESPAEVELRLAGETYTGKAQIEAGDAETLDYMVGYLAERPIDAKAYGLAKAEITRDKIADHAAHRPDPYRRHAVRIASAPGRFRGRLWPAGHCRRVPAVTSWSRSSQVPPPFGIGSGSSVTGRTSVPQT